MVPISHPRLFAATLALTLVHCKNNEGTSGQGKATAAAATPSATASTPRASVPGDVCALLSAAAVGAILGETVEAKAVPGGGCQFAGGTRKSLYPTISIAEDVAGAGGIKGAKSGAQAVTGGVASPLGVGGVTGYVVTGKMGGSVASQAAVSIHGLLVTATVSGGEKESNEKVLAEILKLAVVKL